MEEKSLKMYSAILVIVVLTIVALWALRPFFGALITGLILGALLVKPHEYLTNKLKFNRNLSSLLVILLSILIIIIPVFTILGIVGNQILNSLESVPAIISSFESVDNAIPQINLREKIQGILPQVGKFTVNLISGFLAKTSSVLFGLFMAYFLVFFLLSTPKETRRKHLYSIIPFSEKNSIKLIEKFAAISTSTLKTSGIIALVQGGLLTLLLLILNIQGAFTWGVIGAIMSFIPAVGTFVVWVPIAIVLAVNGLYLPAIILVIGGFLISTVDNVLRPKLQSSGAAHMHPFITFLGVFMGISAFGLIGLIVGPLLLTFIFMTVKMFNEEYVN